MNEKTYTVYMLRFPDGICYIGCTASFKRRMYIHKSAFNMGTSQNKRWKDACAKGIPYEQTVIDDGLTAFAALELEMSTIVDTGSDLCVNKRKQWIGTEPRVVYSEQAVTSGVEFEGRTYLSLSRYARYVGSSAPCAAMHAAWRDGHVLHQIYISHDDEFFPINKRKLININHLTVLFRHN